MAVYTVKWGWDPDWAYFVELTDEERAALDAVMKAADIDYSILPVSQATNSLKEFEEVLRDTGVIE